jgi:hypothetical protein
MARTHVDAHPLAATVPAVAPARRWSSKTVPFELGRSGTNAPTSKKADHASLATGREPLERAALQTALSEDEYRVPVKAELEYSNAASSDWRVAFRISWVDESGESIDGYNGSHQLSEKKDFERASGTVTTLRYGLARAKKLRLLLSIKPD